MSSRILLIALSCVFVSVVESIGTGGTNLPASTATCANNICSNGCTTTSCSPQTCTSVSNSDLAMPTETMDYAGQISGATCNSACTASTAPICGALSSIFMGTGIKAAYCTDQFLVIHTTGYPNHENWLAGIPRPPGGDGDYATADVVRTMRAQYQTYKIPLSVTVSSDPSGQTMQSKLPSANLPSAGAVGVTLSGVPIYPALDNADILAWAACESDQCNAHAGKGFDYHYHGDPFGQNCMYDASMYPSGLNHPMIMGFALDGYLIFGRYTDASTQTTASEALDTCGGHTHGEFGYHYHAHVETGRSPASGNVGEFTAYWNAPRLCFKGDLSRIPTLWQSNNAQINYDNTFSSPRNTISSRNDYCFLRPCCGTTSAYTASGITLSTSASSAGQTTACTDSMTQSNAANDGSLFSAKTSWQGTYTSSPSPSPSCTVPTTSSATAFTANSNTYMCSAKGITAPSTYTTASLSTSASTGFGCCQTTNSNTVTCTCSAYGSDATIACFSYASSGKVSGSCGSCTTSLSDGDCTADLPSTVGDSCVGKASCALTFTGTTAASSTVSAAALAFLTNSGTTRTSNTCSAGQGVVNHKVLVYCNGGTASPTPTPTPTPTSPTPTPASYASTVSATCTFSATLTDAQITTAKASYQSTVTTKYAGFVVSSVTMAESRRSKAYILAANGVLSDAAAFAAVSKSAFSDALDASLEAALPGISVSVANVQTSTSSAVALGANTWMLLCISALSVWFSM